MDELHAWLTPQLYRADPVCAVVAAREFEFEGGEEVSCSRMMPSAPLGGHAGDDLAFPPQEVLVRGPELAALVCVAERWLRLYLPVSEGPVAGGDHKSGIQARNQLTAD